MLEGGIRLQQSDNNPTTKQPVFSVVTAVYNGAAHLEQTIQSVLQQSYGSIEYIVIDGGSTDGTLDILRQYEQHIHYWKSESDQGVYDAMNQGITLARGEVIGLLNADDFYYRETVKTVMEKHQNNVAGIYYGNVCHIQEMQDRSLIRTGIPNLDGMQETMTIIHPACFVTKATYTKIGTYDTSYRIAADYDFLLRGLRGGIQYHYIDQQLTGYRGGGLSAANCSSILEAQTIKEKQLGGTYPEMQAKYERCVKRQRLRKWLYAAASLLGFRKRLDQRVIKIWNQR